MQLTAVVALLHVLQLLVLRRVFSLLQALEERVHYHIYVGSHYIFEHLKCEGEIKYVLNRSVAGFLTRGRSLLLVLYYDVLVVGVADVPIDVQ